MVYSFMLPVDVTHNLRRYVTLYALCKYKTTINLRNLLAKAKND